MPGLVWFGELYDPMKYSIFQIYYITIQLTKYLKLSETFACRIKFFCKKAISKTLLFLHPMYTVDTPSQVLFDLANPRKQSNILYNWKLIIRTSRKFPYAILNFLLDNLCQKFFSF